MLILTGFGMMSVMAAITCTVSLIKGEYYILGYWGLLFWLGLIPTVLGFWYFKSKSEEYDPYDNLREK